MNAPLLEVEGLSCSFRIPTAPLRYVTLHAVAEVDLTLHAGRSLAIVGESGSGKTTLGRLVARLIDPTTGSVRLHGVDLTRLTGRALQAQRSNIQMVFQDPGGSISPWQTIGQTVGEPLDLHRRLVRAERDSLVLETLSRVGLEPAFAGRFPHQLSGGQLQRVAIARAVIADPKLIILDEPTSALDMSVQAQILLLLRSLQRERQLTYIFISHDLSVVRFIADEVAVMYLGRVVEQAPVEQLFKSPLHPYTVALLSAAPRPDPTRKPTRTRLRGEQPSPIDLPPGCPLFGRCPEGLSACSRMRQNLVEASDGHAVACWRHAPPPDLPEELVGQVATRAGK